MHFTKMNGAGNDFILLDAIAEPFAIDNAPAIARALCDRRRSIGADGLMIVDRAEADADYRMRFYNSDGSVGEMCGNGARCICRYGFETGLAGETQRVETTAGLVTGQRIDRQQYRIRLNDPTTLTMDFPLQACGKEYRMAYVELGDPGLPHAVVEMPGLQALSFDELRPLGKALRSHPAFPKGANVNFYDLVGPDHLVEKTFERGVEDFTYACGTGTGSVVTILTLQGAVSGKRVRVDVPGGTLYVDIDRQDFAIRNLYLTGPTNIICQGKITDETLSL